MVTLTDLAKKFNLDYQGKGDVELHKVATLASAGKGDISFLSNPAYQKELARCQADVVIIHPSAASQFSGSKIISEQPYVTFAKVASYFANQHKPPVSGIHPQASIDPTANIAEAVSIGAFSVIGPEVTIGEGSRIGSRVTLETRSKIGAHCELRSGVVIETDCQLGDRVTLHAGVVIGADGFGLARDNDSWLKIPQTGRVIIGDDCSIGANTTVDRGALEDTVLEADVHLDNQIQVGHNVRIGAHTVIAGCAAIAGSARIGQNCLIGGGAGVVGHISICDGVTIQAMALVTRDIKKTGIYGSVAPLQDSKNWRKTAVRIKQLDDLARRIQKLERTQDD